ncbi:MAG TPA: hypothetical protein VJS18_21140 [Paraburkholderia sp.]|nr:hypothetical protein [Paraburkholderia sp.]
MRVIATPIVPSPQPQQSLPQIVPRVELLPSPQSPQQPQRVLPFPELLPRVEITPPIERQITPIPMPSGYELHVFAGLSKRGQLRWQMLGPAKETEAGDPPELRDIASTGLLSSLAPHGAGNPLDRSTDEWIGVGFVPAEVLPAMVDAIRQLTEVNTNG